jgi:hypothetical protein
MKCRRSALRLVQRQSCAELGASMIVVCLTVLAGGALLLLASRWHWRDVVLDLRVKVSLTVLDGETGRPVEGAEVYVSADPTSLRSTTWRRSERENHLRSAMKCRTAAAQADSSHRLSYARASRVSGFGRSDARGVVTLEYWPFYSCGQTLLDAVLQRGLTPPPPYTGVGGIFIESRDLRSAMVSSGAGTWLARPGTPGMMCAELRVGTVRLYP